MLLKQKYNTIMSKILPKDDPDADGGTEKVVK